MSRSVLTAIKPVFAEGIYCRSKPFEFRRMRAKFRPCDQISIYESYPKSCLLGEFQVGQVITGSSFDLTLMEPVLDIRNLAARYLSGAKIATTIEILRSMRWGKCFDLIEVFPSYRPPQFYTFVKA